MVSCSLFCNCITKERESKEHSLSSHIDTKLLLSIKKVLNSLQFFSASSKCHTKKKKNINLYSLTFHTKTELLLSIRKVLDLSISLVFLFFFQEKKSSFTSHMDKTILQKIKDDVKVAVVLHIFICLQV